jgi:hypothetical protein
VGKERAAFNAYKNGQRRQRAIAAKRQERLGLGAVKNFSRKFETPEGGRCTTYQDERRSTPGRQECRGGNQAGLEFLPLDSFFASSDKERGDAWPRSFFSGEMSFGPKLAFSICSPSCMIVFAK